MPPSVPAPRLDDVPDYSGLVEAAARAVGATLERRQIDNKEAKDARVSALAGGTELDQALIQNLGRLGPDAGEEGTRALSQTLTALGLPDVVSQHKALRARGSQAAQVAVRDVRANLEQFLRPGENNGSALQEALETARSGGLPDVYSFSAVAQDEYSGTFDRLEAQLVDAFTRLSAQRDRAFAAEVVTGEVALGDADGAFRGWMHLLGADEAAARFEIFGELAEAIQREVLPLGLEPYPVLVDALAVAIGETEDADEKRLLFDRALRFRGGGLKLEGPGVPANVIERLAALDEVVEQAEEEQRNEHRQRRAENILDLRLIVTAVAEHAAREAGALRQDRVQAATEAVRQLRDGELAESGEIADLLTGVPGAVLDEIYAGAPAAAVTAVLEETSELGAREDDAIVNAAQDAIADGDVARARLLRDQASARARGRIDEFLDGSRAVVEAANQRVFRDLESELRRTAEEAQALGVDASTQAQELLRQYQEEKRYVAQGTFESAAEASAELLKAVQPVRDRLTQFRASQGRTLATSNDTSRTIRAQITQGDLEGAQQQLSQGIAAGTLIEEHQARLQISIENQTALRADIASQATNLGNTLLQDGLAASTKFRDLEGDDVAQARVVRQGRDFITREVQAILQDQYAQGRTPAQVRAALPRSEAAVRNAFLTEEFSPGEDLTGVGVQPLDIERRAARGAATGQVQFAQQELDKAVFRATGVPQDFGFSAGAIATETLALQSIGQGREALAELQDTGGLAFMRALTPQDRTSITASMILAGGTPVTIGADGGASIRFETGLGGLVEARQALTGIRAAATLPTELIDQAITALDKLDPAQPVSEQFLQPTSIEVEGFRMVVESTGGLVSRGVGIQLEVELPRELVTGPLTTLDGSAIDIARESDAARRRLKRLLGVPDGGNTLEAAELGVQLTRTYGARVLTR